MTARRSRFWLEMRAPGDINLRREIATALAVVAMLLQVVFAPILIEQHAFAAETDYGLTLICGSAADHQDPASAGDPAAPGSGHRSHECPCCLGMGGQAIMPEPATLSVNPQVFAFVGQIGPAEAQVVAIATISDVQLPRAPPIFG